VSELILGGQKSGKSRRAEMLAAQWLAQSPDRRAVLLASGLAFDAEMQQRIARHQADRAERVPRMETLEEPLDLAAAVLRHSGPETLLLVDCLTLWLTNLTMPAHGEAASPELPIAALLEALRIAPGPVILVSNEIGMGVIPMGQQVRSFVDALGNLHQQVAAQCQRVTLMVAGFPVFVRDVA
jgi:adenosylcobinamide kinase/adenosylcobinamide-phosphate guanylyltransferase